MATDGRGINRRRTLELLGGTTLLGSSGYLGLLGGCSGAGEAGEEASTARLPLAELPAG